MKRFKLFLIGILAFIVFAGSLRIYTLWSTNWECDVVGTCSCETLQKYGYVVDTCLKNLEVHRKISQ